ncbi:MAG: tRNA lysidine(34) synthetase TilS [Prevotella sp.]|nr:tRNA lysidine(34) synthetase TilS [Prevotella sp.]
MAKRHPFIRTIEEFIQQHRLLKHDSKYLVALSGGADSVALLHVLLHLGYKVEAAHCNFQLRGEEAKRDEDFCRSLCEEHTVAFHTAHFATREYAELRHISIEMAARRLRYDYFEQLRNDIGAEAVAVAHHRDDSVETILLNLIRGTGIHGLTGIAPSRDHVVRPLLCVGRTDIEAFLQEQGLGYVTDSSNLVDDVVRNKIRLDILPLMREINPSVAQSIAVTADRLRQVATIFDDTMAQRVEKAEIHKNSLKSLKSLATLKSLTTLKSLKSLATLKSLKIYDLALIPDEYTLFYVLRPFGFSPAAISDIFKAMGHQHSGTEFSSSTHEMVFHQGMMLVRPIRQPFKPIVIPEEGCYVIPDAGKIRISCCKVDERFVIPKEANKVALNVDDIRFPLTLRTMRNGDKFTPLGMRGTKLVSDFLTDLKASLFEKRDQLLLTDVNDNIIWVVGRRPDNRYRVTTHTKEVIVVEWISQ